MSKNVRGKVLLTDEQRAKLQFINEAKLALATAKTTLMAKARAEVERQLQEYQDTLDRAVYEAVEMGIPKSRVGSEGLGTTAPATVYAHLARWGEHLNVTLKGAPVEARARFEKVSEYTASTGDRFMLVRDAEALVQPYVDLSVAFPNMDYSGEGFLFIKVRGQDWQHINAILPTWEQYGMPEETVAKMRQGDAPEGIDAWVISHGA